MIHIRNGQNQYKWLILLVATFSQTCASFVVFGIGPMAAFYQQEFDLSQLQTGLIVSAVNIGPIFSMLVFGNLMDRYGEKWVVGLGSLFLGINTMISYFIGQYLFLLINLVCVGVWYGTAQPGGSSAIVKWFPGNIRGLAMGIRQTGIPIGGALASAFLPFFFQQYGLSSAILVQGAVAIIGGLIFLLFYKNKGEGQSSKPVPFMEKINRIKSSKRLYPVFFIGMTMVSLQLIIVGHFIGYLMTQLQADLRMAGILLSLAMAGGMFGRVILAWISDRLYNGGRSKPLLLTIWSTVILLVIYAFLPTGVSLTIAGILSFFLGFLGIGWYSLFIVLIAERSDSAMIGLTVSFALTLNQVFIVLSPAVFGLLVDHLGYPFSLLLLSAFIFLGGLWLRISEKE